jgi:hypothetical protein
MTPNLNAQIIVHAPDSDPRMFVCERWPLPATHSAMISIVPTVASGPALASATTLAHALRRTLWKMHPSGGPSTCSGPGPVGCQGHGQPTTRCVLVLVGDGGTVSDYSGAIACWAAALSRDSRYSVVPACPAGTRLAFIAHLPQAFRHLNVLQWTRSPAEAVTPSLAAAGTTAPDQRVFISYRQQDGQEHADDLFEALTSRGFDVFLDRVRIGAGASIPDRIREEIAHKSILMVLETPLVSGSSWVAQEVAIAAANRVGLLAINFPDGHRFPSISGRRRHCLVGADLVASGTRLTSSAIHDVCERLSSVHDRWLVRRRFQMQQAFSNILLHRGLTNHRLNYNGCLEVVPTWSQSTICSVRVTPRLAELVDFRETNPAPPLPLRRTRAVIAPGSLIAGHRLIDMRWLADATRTTLFDESDMAGVATILADPTRSELI